MRTRNYHLKYIFETFHWNFRKCTYKQEYYANNFKWRKNIKIVIFSVDMRLPLPSAVKIRNLD